MTVAQLISLGMGKHTNKQVIALYKRYREVLAEPAVGWGIYTIWNLDYDYWKLDHDYADAELKHALYAVTVKAPLTRVADYYFYNDIIYMNSFGDVYQLRNEKDR